MIDLKTRKGQTLAGMVLALTAAHAIRDDVRSQEIEGAVDLARLLMISNSRGQYRAVEAVLDESKSNRENAKAITDHTPNPEYQAILDSFTYEQLVSMARVTEVLSAVFSAVAGVIQFAARVHYPEQFERDMEKIVAEAEAEGIMVIDLRTPPKKEPTSGDAVGR